MNLNKRFSIDQLHVCARREVAQRKKVYLRLVRTGSMTQETADREIAMMQAIAEFLDEQSKPKLI